MTSASRPSRAESNARRSPSNAAETASTASPSAVAARVLGLEREPCLGRPERQLVAVPRDPCGEQGVLECVLLLGELARHEPVLAGEPQPGDRLAVAVLCRGLGLVERLELLAREEIRVPRDDRRLLRRLLLPHPHGPCLLGALDPVGLEPGLVPRQPCVRSRGDSSTPRRSRSSVVSRPRSSSDSYSPGEMREPVTATRIGA